MRPPWACGVGDLAAALAAFSRRITDHGRTLPLRSHGWLAQEMVHPILTRMWKRRHPPSLSKAILVAVNAWRLLHVQVHEAAKKTVIGRRLCVYWKDDSLWYCGIINDYDPKDDKHLVRPLRLQSAPPVLFEASAPSARLVAPSAQAAPTD